eukprot:CAMPEP_0202892774 /NCGR_PEP_ID=MMETSP1392-20130828/2470_1 /ASSEMBLY_ACC=CAM_ASM_000868 /TAXON_ID=225041 /ORGANISM="Chlamydomonas chlamydogama, Strain SAG 11-48b" /LENGTH=146 /DNA_ID=CAMNT_0049576851 /DNA_START=174 /DNA_END=610 /DNA_ORIENTATION=-
MTERARRFFGRAEETDSGQMELRGVGSETGRFEDFLCNSPKEEVVKFFRDMTSELEQDLQLEDYHLKVQNNFDFERFRNLPGWQVVVFYGGSRDKEGPLQVRTCMSCSLDCSLRLGVVGEEAGQPPHHHPPHTSSHPPSGPPYNTA